MAPSVESTISDCRGGLSKSFEDAQILLRSSARDRFSARKVRPCITLQETAALVSPDDDDTFASLDEPDRDFRPWRGVERETMLRRWTGTSGCS
jgi:hypothetical protein